LAGLHLVYARHKDPTSGVRPPLVLPTFTREWKSLDIRYPLSPRLHTAQNHVMSQIVDFNDCKTTLAVTQGQIGSSDT